MVLFLSVKVMQVHAHNYLTLYWAKVLTIYLTDCHGLNFHPSTEKAVNGDHTGRSLQMPSQRMMQSLS